MKKIFLVLAVSVTILSCNKVAKGEFLISGTAKGIADGKTVVLEKQDDSGQSLIPVDVDTVKVKGGKFEIKGKIAEPAFYTLQVEGAQGKIPVIVENEAIKVTIDKDSIQNSKVSGSYSNDELYKFNLEMKKVNKSVQKESTDFQTKNMQAMEAARKVKDTVVINKLMKEFSKIQEVVTGKYVTYAETHPKSFISVLIIDGMFKQPKVEIEKIKKMYGGLDKSLQNTKPGKSIKTNIDNFGKVSASSGIPVPTPSANPNGATSNWNSDFSAPSVDGKLISLKQIAGKVTIVDFWASWCGPCRLENPNVVKIYKEFHDQGLNIIGVSLDEDSKKWKDAIAKDGLVWNQVSNLKGWEDPIAKKFGVDQIPATFIFDSKGNIVAKDLSGEELRMKIKELLSK